MRSSKRVQWWVRGAVLVPAVLVALWPAGDVAGGAADRATLPEELAGYSYLTASVSTSAPGRAIALYQHGFGVEFMDFPQAVVAGADGETTRRLDVAEQRGGGGAQDDAAPMLLSPDGTRVAVGTRLVGTPDDPPPDLLVVDLADGSVEEHPVPARRSVLPLAWSPDGERIAYRGRAQPGSDYAASPFVGDVGVLDLADGEAAALPGAEDATAVAFSPDGSELAVQHGSGTLRIVDAQRGGVLRTVRVPSNHVLGAPDAWSPDGDLLAVSAVRSPCRFEDELYLCEEVGRDPDGSIAFVDATGAGASPPPPLDRGGHPVLGWTAADRIVLLVPEPDAVGVDPDRQWITEVPLDGGERQRLASVPTGFGNYAVSRFQLAGGLLPDAEATDTGAVDRGPWPLWLRLIAAVAVALLVARIVGPVLVRRTARDGPAQRLAISGPPTSPGPARSAASTIV